MIPYTNQICIILYYYYIIIIVLYLYNQTFGFTFWHYTSQDSLANYVKWSNVWEYNFFFSLDGILGVGGEENITDHPQCERCSVVLVYMLDSWQTGTGPIHTYIALCYKAKVPEANRHSAGAW